MEKTTISLSNNTPMWARRTVRGLTWVTGLWAMLLTLGVDLGDFGVSQAVEILVLKYMAIASGSGSVLARFLGVKEVKLDTDKPMTKN